MSTRSVIAVERDGAWKGVHHRCESYPWQLGNTLLQKGQGYNHQFWAFVEPAGPS